MSNASPMTPGSPDAPEIWIGVCTFRRPELEITLNSLARIDRAGTAVGVGVGVVIADNDSTPSAQPLVERIAATFPMPLIYLHAPERNISIARNALLDHARRARARLLLSIDDDQWVGPDWLDQMLKPWREGQDGAPESRIGAVLGPVHGVYQPGTPDWMERGRLHDTVPVRRRDGAIVSGYTGNTLLDLADPALSDLRFDVARGRSGGEDTAFFSAYLRAGGRIAFAPDATAEETVPADRASLRWLLRRRYRMGQTHASLIARNRSRTGRLGQAGIAAAKAAACGGMALLGAGRPAWRNRQLMRAALHIGAGAYLAGAPRIELYGTPPVCAGSVQPDGQGGPKGPKGT